MESSVDKLMVQVYKCANVLNVCWGVWALTLLKPEDYSNPNLFNWDYCNARLEMFHKIKQVVNK